MGQNNLEQNTSSIVRNNEGQNRKWSAQALHSRDLPSIRMISMLPMPWRGGFGAFQGAPGSNRRPPACLYPVKNYSPRTLKNRRLYSAWLLHLVKVAAVFYKRGNFFLLWSFTLRAILKWKEPQTAFHLDCRTERVFLFYHYYYYYDHYDDHRLEKQVRKANPHSFPLQTALMASSVLFLSLCTSLISQVMNPNV